MKCSRDSGIYLINNCWLTKNTVARENNESVFSFLVFCLNWPWNVNWSSPKFHILTKKMFLRWQNTHSRDLLCLEWIHPWNRTEWGKGRWASVLITGWTTFGSNHLGNNSRSVLQLWIRPLKCPGGILDHSYMLQIMFLGYFLSALLRSFHSISLGVRSACLKFAKDSVDFLSCYWESDLGIH